MQQVTSMLNLSLRFLTISCAALPTSLFGASFQAGWAAVDITPPIGYRMSGYFHERLAEGTKDPLLAKAIVFSQADVTAALVECDISSVSSQVAHESRRREDE